MNRLLSFCAPLLTMVVIYGSLTANPEVPIVFEDYTDKVYHLTAYFLLMISWFLFFKNRYLSTQFSAKRMLWADLFSFERSIIIGAATLCFIIGSIIELAQGYLVKNRSMEWDDVLANTVGILFATCILFLFDKLLIKSSKKNVF